MHKKYMCKTLSVNQQNNNYINELKYAMIEKTPQNIYMMNLSIISINI